jgi:beta-phosphoglucomutase
MKKLRLTIKAAIFDMDGVITNTMPDHYRAWKEIFKREGICVSEREIYRREGQPGHITVREIFEDLGIAYHERQVSRILKDKEDFFKKIVRRRFIPGSRRFLRDMKRRGFRLALVTGTARHEVERILPRDLLSLFCVTVAGDEVARGKPHPEPYLSALKKLDIKPHEAVVIENAPFGILSAKEANLSCLALGTSLPKSYLRGADHIFHSFKSLRRAVAFLKA